MSDKNIKAINNSAKSSINKNQPKIDDEKFNIPNFIALESVIGAICFLAMKSQSHKYLFNCDLEWLVVPAVAQKQFKLFRNKNNEPLAFISWANINEEVENRLLNGFIKLQPKDWNCGDKRYIIDIISPFVAVKEIIKEFKQHNDQQVKIIRSKKEGKGLEGIDIDEFILT